jgi:hypothetical protein
VAPDDVIANDAATTADPDAVLARTPPERWSELAWQWIDDAAGHRALLARLAQTRGAELAAIEALGDASDGERAVALPRVAAELSAELEAVLVGCLVRDDRLAGAPALGRGHADRAGGAGRADDDDDRGGAPDPARVAAALAMTRRGLLLAPGDGDLQFTHAMLLVDAEHAGDPARLDELFAALATFTPPVRLQVVTRMGTLGHPRFGEAIERVLAEVVPARSPGERATCGGGAAAIASRDEIAPELFGELGEAILARAPSQLARLVPHLPDDAALLAGLAAQAVEAHACAAALALYDRLIALPIPGDRGERMSYLRALGEACVEAHAAGAFDAAVRLADRAQPVAYEHPCLYHAAACAYAAVHDYVRAFEQVKLAIEHGYDQVANIETDAALGRFLEWPALKVLLRDWHARRDGN